MAANGDFTAAKKDFHRERKKKKKKKKEIEEEKKTFSRLDGNPVQTLQGNGIIAKEKQFRLKLVQMELIELMSRI